MTRARLMDEGERTKEEAATHIHMDLIACTPLGLPTPPPPSVVCNRAMRDICRRIFFSPVTRVCGFGSFHKRVKCVFFSSYLFACRMEAWWSGLVLQAHLLTSPTYSLIHSLCLVVVLCCLVYVVSDHVYAPRIR